LNIGRETVRKILVKDLDMRKLCAKMVPKELTEEQKERRVTRGFQKVRFPIFLPPKYFT